MKFILLDLKIVIKFDQTMANHVALFINDLFYDRMIVK